MKRGMMWVCVLACLAAAWGCSDESDEGGSAANNSAGNNSAANNSAGEEDAGNNSSGGEDAGDEDIPTIGDVGSGNNNSGCDAIGARADAWPLHGEVSSGAVTSSEAGGVLTAEVDASAGGSAASANMPFVYLDLDSGGKVEVTDLEAGREDATWELAFRRTAIFVNGGDAGPGSVEIARLTGAEFDAVNARDIPADAAFTTEASVDSLCEVIPPPSGFGSVISVMDVLNPDTSSGSWYDYSGGGGHGVAPYPDHVYIIRGTDGGATYKVSLVSWEGGVITLKWAAL